MDWIDTLIWCCRAGLKDEFRFKGENNNKTQPRQFQRIQKDLQSDLEGPPKSGTRVNTVSYLFFLVTSNINTLQTLSLPLLGHAGLSGCLYEPNSNMDYWTFNIYELHIYIYYLFDLCAYTCFLVLFQKTCSLHRIWLQRNHWRSLSSSDHPSMYNVVTAFDHAYCSAFESECFHSVPPTFPSAETHYI